MVSRVSTGERVATILSCAGSCSFWLWPPARRPPASAVTLAEVVALSKAGVSEPVILALIERDQTLFSMPPDQLVKLQREGLSDTILLALLKSGRPSDVPLATSPVALAASQPLAPPPADGRRRGPRPRVPEHAQRGRDAGDGCPARSSAVRRACLRACAASRAALGAASPPRTWRGVSRAHGEPAAVCRARLHRHVSVLAGVDSCHRMSPAMQRVAHQSLIATKARNHEDLFPGGTTRISDYDLRMKSRILTYTALLALILGSGLQAQKAAPKQAQKIDEEYTTTDQAEPAGSAHHDRAGRSPAGVRHGAVAAQVPRPRRRHAGRADVREGHLPLLRGAREGGADARQVLEDRHDRGRPRHRRCSRSPTKRRSSTLDKYQRHARRAHRSAQDDRSAGAAAARTPPSRSTTRSAACTRRRPAVPRC